MKRHHSISFVSSMFAVVCYLAFTLLAFSRYPLPYSPLSNWLSDLGNANLNPSGALFYNIGIIATGVVVLPFFLGLSQWKSVSSYLPEMASHSGCLNRLCGDAVWHLSYGHCA